MEAMILEQPSLIENKPLVPKKLPIPQAGPKQIIVKITSCGICHTDLDEIEGRLQSILPVIPGHQIVGTVENLGPGARKFKHGQRVGIAWINSACGRGVCSFYATMKILP